MMAGEALAEFKIRYKHVVEDMDRHGNVRLYYREKGKGKVRLRETPGTEAFEEEYKRAGEGRLVITPSTTPEKSPLPDTFGWLCDQYYNDTLTFKKLHESTQSKRRAILKGICQEPIAPDSADLITNCPLRCFSTAHVEMVRDRKVDTPEAANNRVKALSRLFKFAKKKKVNGKPLVKNDPTLEVEKFSSGSEGWHTWTIEEIRQYIRRWPLGTKQYLAFALLYYMSQRKSDVIMVGKPHETPRGTLVFTQTKNKGRKPVRIEIDILPELRQAIDACPSKGLTYLETDYGLPFTVAGFGGSFRIWCDKAGLPQCSSHGLRKAASSIAAEKGATEAQLAAINGWSDMRQASVYTKKANRTKMARDAMPLLSIDLDEDGTEVSHSQEGFKKGGTK